jgi:hypothetical protein
MQITLKNREQLIILLAIAVMAGHTKTSSAETWQLKQDQDWKPVQTTEEDKYLLVMVRTENLLDTGRTLDLYEEWNSLRKQFPEIAEEDLNLFIEAELLLCEQKLTKASRNYTKFLNKDYQDSNLYNVAMERLFRIAKAYLAGHKKTVLGIFKIKGYAEGIKIMESITDRAGEKPIGIQAAVAVAENYEERKMFNEAHLKWSEISWQWKTGEIAKQALLSMARCKHAAYQGPKYNASSLEILKQINEQIAYKQLTVGRYYQKTGSRRAANLYFQMVIRNWPETESAELAKEALTENINVAETQND